ncbi:MAG: DUF763 domain-containing protein [Methanobacteriota archaeon]|nr:MAG: DUF763 domain-containing protein [Euryarchaeota archaeon]
MARRSGMMELPLHGGATPRWLFGRMVNLSGAISEAVVDEYGSAELLRRLADPLWFQAFSCVIGFDWHSSGTTTVTCGALRKGLEDAGIGVRLAGGKGANVRDAVGQIRWLADAGFISDASANELERSSRLSAKVDSCAVQDGHDIYHHTIIFDESGRWTVVQQGMSDRTGFARRYHWCSSDLDGDFVREPHTGIAGTRTGEVLDLTSDASTQARVVSTDLGCEKPSRVEGIIRMASLGHQKSLTEFTDRAEETLFRSYMMPKRVDWNALRRCYEAQPTNYEELLLVKGVGPKLTRALALISQAVYGAPLSWEDPVKFSFAVGGKDGVPFPVDRESMDAATRTLREAVDQSRIGVQDRKDALKRLSRCAGGSS